LTLQQIKFFKVINNWDGVFMTSIDQTIFSMYWSLLKPLHIT
jgi:hypothetical protein